jgi:hypothetical protein
VIPSIRSVQVFKAGPWSTIPDEWAGCGRLGVDEHSFLAATREHHTIFATALVDLDRPTGDRLVRRKIGCPPAKLVLPPVEALAGRSASSGVGSDRHLPGWPVAAPVARRARGRPVMGNSA